MTGLPFFSRTVVALDQPGHQPLTVGQQRGQPVIVLERRVHQPGGALGVTDEVHVNTLPAGARM